MNGGISYGIFEWCRNVTSRRNWAMETHISDVSVANCIFHMPNVAITQRLPFLFAFLYWVSWMKFFVPSRHLLFSARHYFAKPTLQKMICHFKLLWIDIFVTFIFLHPWKYKIFSISPSFLYLRWCNYISRMIRIYHKFLVIFIGRKRAITKSNRSILR